MHYAKRISHLLLVLFMMVSAASFAGCDSGGDDDDDNGNGGQTGTFNVEITGEGIDDSFTGVAFFGVGEDPETGQDAFVIWLTPSQNQQTSTGVWFYLLNERPDTGTFTLVNLNEGDPESELDSSFGAMLWSQNVTYLGTAGTIRLTSSSSTRVAGEFDFTATGFSVGAPEGVQVTVEGSFNALSTGNIVFPI